ncbi:unnamed protein product [Mycena citricolor]|uniref:Uncharacterized protein n=1 Tax=Mycena citricolor TaxID=2018698 RepID=A0AAD2K1U4_9AGAR|nr:unnamed protein product [Mycena citricolor]
MRALEHLLMNSFPHLSPFELLSPKLGPANDQSGASSDLGMDSMTGSEMGLVREVILGVLSSSEPDDEAPKCAYKDRIFFDGVHRAGAQTVMKSAFATSHLFLASNPQSRVSSTPSS